jgi:hypothetical protein
MGNYLQQDVRRPAKRSDELRHVWQDVPTT